MRSIEGYVVDDAQDAFLSATDAGLAGGPGGTNVRVVIDGVILEGDEDGDDVDDRAVPANVTAAVQKTLAMLRGGVGRYDLSGECL